MIWERVLKSVFVGPETLQLGSYDPAAHFNIGCQASIKLLEELRISPGNYCTGEAQRADSVRVLKANYKEQGVNKFQQRLPHCKRKKKLTNNKKRREILMYLVGF